MHFLMRWRMALHVPLPDPTVARPVRVGIHRFTSDRGPEGAHMNANSLGNAAAGMDIPKLERP